MPAPLDPAVLRRFVEFVEFVEFVAGGAVDDDHLRLLDEELALTGEHSLLRDDLRPDLTRVLLPNAGFTDAPVTLARDHCAAALARHRDAGRSLANRPGRLSGPARRSTWRTRATCAGARCPGPRPRR
jgi:hypothetical protein